MGRRKTRTTDEAHAVHEAHRAYLLHAARVIAVRIARECGFVHTRLVRAEMARMGLIAAVPAESIRGPTEKWLGSALRCGPFEKTGERAPRGDASRNIHGGDTVCVWRLREGADLSSYETMPEAPPAAPVTVPVPVVETVATFDRVAAAEELRRIGGEALSENARRALAWMEST